MNEPVKRLADQALRLTSQDRAALAEALLQSLKEADAIHGAEWLQESEDRLAAHRRGELAAENIEEVLRRIDSP